MIRIARVIVAITVLAVPDENRRRRAREEWRGDVERARAIGLSPLGVAVGAAVAAGRAALRCGDPRRRPWRTPAGSLVVGIGVGIGQLATTSGATGPAIVATLAVPALVAGGALNRWLADRAAWSTTDSSRGGDNMNSHDTNHDVPNSPEPGRRPIGPLALGMRLVHRDRRAVTARASALAVGLALALAIGLGALVAT